MRRPRSCLKPGGGSRALGTHDGPGAAPNREVGAEALEHVGTRAYLILCLDLELIRGQSLGYRHASLLVIC
jgi:hypothetical protein